MRKFGIVGIGNMGMLHGKLLAQRAGVQVAGVTDLNAERGREVAKSFDCPFHTTVDALLGSGVDMIFVAIPNTGHAEQTIRGLDAGVDVFVEKPLATNLTDAEKVLAAEKRSGKRVFVGYNRRFAPVYMAAKRILDDRAFKPVNVNMIQNDGDMQNPPWLTDLSMTGGFMYDTTVHFLDMAEYLLGDIVELRALGRNFFYPIVDDFVVQLTFANGAYGVITTCGHASWVSPFERVQVVGDHKSVITEELDTLRYSPSLGGVIDGSDYSKLEHNVKWGYQQMHDHIFDCLDKGKEPINGSREGYRVVKLIEACYQSAERNGEVLKI